MIKEGPLLVLKDAIIHGDVLLVTVGSPELKWDGIRVDNPDGKSKIFPVGAYDGATLGLIDNTMLGIADYFKLLCYIIINF